ncbi:MAG TPA: ABC transporter permease [Thermoanaerobaculia bacterium]|nr:ABC transporter permease [Thermoanaerobaculia bacterium]
MTGGWGWDLRCAARSLARSPGFSAVAIVVLALGIGGTTTIWSVLSSVVLRPLPYGNAGRLVMIWETKPGRTMENTVRPSYFAIWKERSRTCERMAGFFPYLHPTLGGGGTPEELTAASVTGDFFPVLGTPAALGRTFSPGESEVQEVVLSDALWRRKFGGDRHVLGRVLRLNGHPFTVRGVMPPHFQFPPAADLWLPAPHDVPALQFGTESEDQREIEYMRVLGLLRPGVAAAQAQAELEGIARTTMVARGVNVVTLHRQVVGGIRPTLLLLMSAIALVLLIACANLSNLLLARTSARHREMAIRVAVGATGPRLLRQMLAESLLVALAAGAAAWLLARGGLGALLHWLPADVPRLAEIRLDAGALGFTAALALGCGALFGLLPALQASRPDLAGAIRQGATSDPSRQRLQAALLVWELALTLVLLLGAGLLLRSFVRLQTIDPGFRPAHLLSLSIHLPQDRYGEPFQQREFFARLLGRLQELPGVAAAASLNPPISDDFLGGPFAIEGRPAQPAEERRAEGTEFVSPGYFRTLGIPVRAGRELTARDAADAPPVAVVNETVARRYWGGSSPIGQRIAYGNPADPSRRWITIVGVVADVPSVAPDRAPRSMVYRTFLQVPWSFMTVLVRTPGRPLELIPAVRKAVNGIDPEQPIAAVETMEDALAEAVARPRLTLLLVAVFACLATLLAVVGVYGVTMVAVNRRRHEIGLRMALGALRGDILLRVLGRGLALALCGVALGLAGALALSRVLRSLLFAVSPTDTATYLQASLLLIGVTLLASLVPSWRAARLEPLIALRGD